MPFSLKLILVFIPVFGFLFVRRKLTSLWSLIAIFYVVGLSIYPLLSLVRFFYSSYLQPPEWDFLCFWSSGQVAVRGENFYDPQSFHKLSMPYEPSEPFQEEWMDVGFWYPPMTMFLFLPLGLLELHTAYVIWQLINVLLSFACIYILWRLFLEENGLFSLLLIAALLLMLPPSRGTFWFAQTNFLLLFLFLLFWQYRPKAWSGIFIAFCAVVKPYMAILFLYPLLIRKWRLLFVAITTMLLLLLLSIFVFGSEVFIHFLKDPTPDVPGFYYLEQVNQSLLSTILRATGYSELHGSPVASPVYWILSALLVCVTGWTISRKDTPDEWKILSLLFLALLIYPGTLSHYGIFLIVPIVYLLRTAEAHGERALIFVIIFVTYLLSGFNNSGNYIFFAHLFMWLVCISSAMGLLDRIAERVPAFSHRPGLML